MRNCSWEDRTVKEKGEIALLVVVEDVKLDPESRERQEDESG
jgi:hypothetical protein